ncbi:MAG: hypothetical protein KBA18_10250, partial [Kiritimatiellae bacterium]|nr:hypothetical protein [Kiritimatiellia bacterium]
MKTSQALVLLALLPALLGAADRFSTSLSDRGVEMACGPMGAFTLAYPALDLGDGKSHAPIEKRVQGAAATLAYAGGGRIAATVSSDKLTLTFDAMPAAVKAFSVEMLIPPHYGEGGRWRTGDASGAFPQEKPAKPHLYQSHSRSFEFAGLGGEILSFALPEYTYVQLQDNREWNWNTFWVQFKIPFLPERRTYEIEMAMTNTAAPRVVLVDRFGQTTRRDFPGKLKDETELRTDAAAEAAYYAGLIPPARNRFGGLPGSGAKLGLRKTGFFRVERLKVGG